MDRRNPALTMVLALLIGALLISSGALMLHAQTTQLSGTRRTDLQRHDLSIAGREVVQARVDIAPGVSSAEHRHPGEEIVYVLEGTLRYRIEGKTPVTLRAGEVLFIPAGALHAAENVGTDNGAELATYIVEKGKPLVTN